jgi:WD40 repeat protein
MANAKRSHDKAEVGGKPDPLAAAESISRIAAAVAIPIVIAIGGWWIQNSITGQSISKDYVLLAISVLEKPKDEIDQGIRDWAVDLIDATSPTKFSQETIARLKTGSINLGSLSAILSSKSSGVAISPDGKSLAVTARGDMAIRIFNLQTGQLTTQLRGHTGEVTVLAFTPDGKKLFSGSLDKTVKTWDSSTGAVLESWGFPDAVYGLAVNSDGKTVVVGLASDTYLTVDADTGKRLGQLKLGP